MSLQVLRMIDANLNRCSEGLRVLEDVARFALNDLHISRRLKNIRHRLADDTELLRTGFMSGRDSDYDVGGPYYMEHRSEAEDPVLEKPAVSDLSDLITANAKRAQQALRVLEELAKLPELTSAINSGEFERARFALYAIEQELTSMALRRNKIGRLSGLYVILDRKYLGERDEIGVARQAIEGGASVIQLRDKESSRGDLMIMAQKLRDLCRQAGVLFIVNDLLDLAMVVDADGLHIGQRDLPVQVVRKALPVDKLIGCSVNTLSQATRAGDEGADYIAVGSVFPTSSKEQATVVGLDALRDIKQSTSTPIVAIGGINQHNIGEVIAAGADAAAVISAVLKEDSVKRAVEGLISKAGWQGGRCQNP